MNSKTPSTKKFSIKKKPAARDPRFDSACGQFNVGAFENDYKFLKNVKRKEGTRLKKELKQTTETDTAEYKSKSLQLQRLESQKAEEASKRDRNKIKDMKLRYEIEEMKQGRKPYYCKPAEEELLRLIHKYERLKETGKLNKYMIKKQKKRGLQKVKLNSV